ncbi:MAG TPA: hypothetical protein PKE26_13175 [Kiritimatiellia bacterium]|nr:hypothetical protein [Kiritimatiellia bacterium]HMP00055.1 hypothetical protein [Kiritimatiellia bacterium]HMP96540.1 hypothetical protein [Kiritimatiellia bacterium]
MIDTLFHLHLAATGVMTGVIWFVQLIHYPWFHRVPADQFTAYHRAYTEKVGYIVGPAMLVELATGMAWLYLLGDGRTSADWISMVMLAGIWLSTIGLQIPCHQRLAAGYQPDVHRRLVRTNWIRTALWSARLGLLVAPGLI